MIHLIGLLLILLNVISYFGFVHVFCQNIECVYFLF